MLYENKEQLITNMIVKHDVADMDICVKYGGYGWFDVRGITLQENNRDVLPLVLKWIMFFLMIDLLVLLRRKNLTFANCERLRTGYILISFALVASLPMFVGFLPIMDDFAFSFVRIEGIKDAILEGQLPAVVLPNSMLGYGYADPVFYPNILLYFPAAMRVLGFHFMESYKTFIFLMHLLTAGISYYSVKQVFQSNKIGLIGSFLYTFSIYRLIDVYRRSAIGEFCAIAFLPLVVYGLYHILTSDTEKQTYKRSWIPLTVGLWGVANTHLLSCEMAAVFILPVCLVCIRRIFTKARMVQLVKAVGMTLLLTVYFIVPFIDMSLRDFYKVFTNESMNAAESTLSFFQTFSIFFSQLGSAVGYTEGNPPRDLGIGFVFLIGIVLYVYLSGITNDRQQSVQMTGVQSAVLRQRFCKLCCILGCIAIWMTTYHFPWSQIGYQGGLLKKVLFMVQFPWRYTAVATVLLLFVLCDVFRMLQGEKYKHTGYIVMTVFAVLICIQTLYYFQTVPREGETLFYYEEAGLPMSGGNGYGEYEPSDFNDIKIGYNIWQLQEKFGTEEGTIEILAYDQYGTDAVLSVNNLTTEEQKVYLPTLFYPGYMAYDIFSEESLQIFKSEKGTLGVIIPARYMSAVKIEYHISWIYRVGEGITLITLVCLAAAEIKKCKKNV